MSISSNGILQRLPVHDAKILVLMVDTQGNHDQRIQNTWERSANAGSIVILEDMQVQAPPRINIHRLKTIGAAVSYSALRCGRRVSR